ncbi:MAG: type II toxin-antitoxin system prevent-host-death family antitoxin [Deltaproteobacteria bacterium]|nr:type II toxin-antitoxin system prevent-host-death family antitoxin [Deltaproteobacteria bacterium]
MKSAGLKQFKAHLARYVRGVVQGERLLVTYRGRPMVEVRRAVRGHDDPLVAADFVPAKRPNDRRWADRKSYGINAADLLPPGRVAAILDEERGA